MIAVLSTKGIRYEPNEATAEALLLPLEALPYSSQFPCLKGSCVSLGHVLIKLIA